MKIVKKIKLWLERDETGNTLNKGSMLLNGYCSDGRSFVLLRADDISGEMFAMSELTYEDEDIDPNSEIYRDPNCFRLYCQQMAGVLRTPKSKIYFDPNRSNYYDNPEYQLRTFPHRDVSAEVEDSPEYLEQIHKAFIPLKIPLGTKEICLSMYEGDWIRIKACYKEEYVIVDDNGNEIPLEDLLGGKHSS